MGLLLLAGVALVSLAAVRCRPGTAVALVLATIALVPGTLPLPGLPGVLTVHRVVLAAALLGLVRRCACGDVPWRVFSVPPIGWRLLALVGLLGVVGVGLLEPSTDVDAAARSWQTYLAQVLCFVVVLALVRADGRPRRSVMLLAAAASAAAVIALLEHATGQSYARWWFGTVPELLDSDQAQVLARRGGQVRVRAAGDFTLAFAWATAACVPLVLALAALSRGARRAALLVALPVLMLAVIWTFSRSVVLPMLLAVLVVLSRVRGGSLKRGTTALLVLGGALALTDTALRHNFSAAVDQGSIDVRTARLPAVLDLASAHPFKGLGLSGLAPFGFPGTDSSFLLTYAEVGAIGLAALVAVLVAGVLAAGQGLLDADHELQLLGLALGAGAFLLLVGGAVSFDAFTTPSVAELFWVLVALGVAVGEAGARERPAPDPRWQLRAVAVLSLLVVGLGVSALAPHHVARTWQFQTLDTYAATAYAPTYTGVQLRATLCELLDTGLPDTRQTCQPVGSAPGLGTLRLEAGDKRSLHDEEQRVTALLRGAPLLRHVELQPVGPVQSGVPAAMRTAPAWLPLLGGLLLLPLPRRRT